VSIHPESLPTEKNNRPPSAEGNLQPSPLQNQLDPNNPPFTLLQAILTWVGSVALLLLPQILAIPYLISHYRGTKPTAEVLFADKTFILIIVFGIVPAHALILLLAWGVVTRLGKVSWKKVLGWSWQPQFRLRESVVVAILLFIVAMVVIYTFGGQETDLEKLLQSSRVAAVAIAVIAATSAPLVEEIIYRGILYSALQRAMGPLLAIIVVTLMFAGLHVVQYWPDIGAISAIALLSLAITVVRARTGRLLPCFVIHLVFNAIQSLIIIFEPYVRALYHLWRHDNVAAAVSEIWRCLG
jgi:membrane protease YdiL (CAAX protease family)